MAGAASARVTSRKVSAAAPAPGLSREFQPGKMSQGSSGGSGSGSSGEAGPSARQTGEAARAPGAPFRPASRPVQVVVTRALKIRNALTGLAIGSVAVAIYGYTFYSVSQEHFLDELELEAKVVQAHAAKTSAN